MYCSVIMDCIFSFISMSDLNNLRMFITTTMYMLWFKFTSSSNIFKPVYIFQTGSYFFKPILSRMCACVLVIWVKHTGQQLGLSTYLEWLALMLGWELKFMYEYTKTYLYVGIN